VQVADVCGHGIEASGSINCWEFDWKKKYSVLHMDSAVLANDSSVLKKEAADLPET
jgi:hypothetical protein